MICCLSPTSKTSAAEAMEGPWPQPVCLHTALTPLFVASNVSSIKDTTFSMYFIIALKLD